MRRFGCCENCYVEQTLQLINEVNAGRIAKCGNCGFLLYRLTQLSLILMRKNHNSIVANVIP